MRQSRARSAPLAGFVALAFFMSSGSAVADEPQRRTAAGVLYDAAIERPISLAETILGVGITAIAYPLSIGSGQSNVVVDRCITRPARYTFTRALGDFRGRPANDCSPVGFSWSLVKMSLSIVARPLGYVFGRSPLSSEPRKPEHEIEINHEAVKPSTPPFRGGQGAGDGGITI